VIVLTEEEVDVAIRDRLSVVSEQVIYPEMRIEEVRRALQRVNAEDPPNGHKNQQMKDSLLWEACVTLAKKHVVFFVTGDKAFYANRDTSKGLAENLAAEQVVVDGRLRAFPSLEDAMGIFAPESAVSSSEAAEIGAKDLIASSALEVFTRSPVASDLQPQIRLRGVVPTYLRTEVPYVFAVSFTAFFYVNKEIDGRSTGEAAVSGECMLNTRQASIEAVSLRTIHWTLRDPNGGTIKVREVLDSAG
jgi:hypothetical protein